VPAAGRGSLRTVLDELVVLGQQVQAVHPELHVFRWWRPDAALPCLFHWLTPSSRETPPDICTSRDTLRITVSIAVDPFSTVAEDALQLENYADTALDVYDVALAQRRPLGGQSAARRTGMQTVSDRWGEAPVLVLELPVEVTLDRPIVIT
jgi:hypothetical protein